MMKTLLLLAAALTAAFLSVAPAVAETFRVEMRNRGEQGSMVFELDFLAIEPGDSVKFIATQRKHPCAVSRLLQGAFFYAQKFVNHPKYEKRRTEIR